MFDAKVPLPFIAKLFEKDHLVPNGSGLVPGCGRGYAVQAFARGDRHVTGLDLAPTATAAAKAFLDQQVADGSLEARFSVKTGSFFDLPSAEGGVYDFAYDYTFLCALPPTLRQDWASTYQRLLKPGGALITVVFPITASKPPSSGPPYPLTEHLVADLLEPLGFTAVFRQKLGPGEAHAGRDGSETAMGATAIIVWKKNISTAANGETATTTATTTTNSGASHDAAGGGGGGSDSAAAADGTDSVVVVDGGDAGAGVGVNATTTDEAE